MTVCHTLRNIFKDVLGLILGQLFRLLDLVVEVATTSILHHHHYMLFVFKNFIKTNDVGVTDFLKNVNFLEYLFTRVLIFKLR